MAIRTAQERPGLPWPTPFLAGPELDRTARRRDDPAPAQEVATRPTLALLLTLAGCWGFWLVGYCSGRTAERGSQLGQVLALAPAQDSIDAVLGWARGLRARLDALPKIRLPATARVGTAKVPVIAPRAPAPNLPVRATPQP